MPELEFLGPETKEKELEFLGPGKPQEGGIEFLGPKNQREEFEKRREELIGGIGEAVLKEVSGLAGAAIGGLAAISKALRGEDAPLSPMIPPGAPLYPPTLEDKRSPLEVSQSVSEGLTYQPKTETGKAITEKVAVPFEKLREAGQALGQQALDQPVTEMDKLMAGEKGAEAGRLPSAIVMATAIEALPLALPSVFKGVKNSTWYRKMSVKERAVVVVSLEDMLNKGMSEGEILKKWNNPQWRQEAVERRATADPTTAEKFKGETVKPEEIKPITIEDIKESIDRPETQFLKKKIKDRYFKEEKPAPAEEVTIQTKGMTAEEFLKATEPSKVEPPTPPKTPIAEQAKPEVEAKLTRKQQADKAKGKFPVAGLIKEIESDVKPDVRLDFYRKQYRKFTPDQKKLLAQWAGRTDTDIAKRVLREVQPRAPKVPEAPPKISKKLHELTKKLEPGDYRVARNKGPKGWRWEAIDPQGRRRESQSSTKPKAEEAAISWARREKGERPFIEETLEDNPGLNEGLLHAAANEIARDLQDKMTTKSYPPEVRGTMQGDIKALYRWGDTGEEIGPRGGKAFLKYRQEVIDKAYEFLDFEKGAEYEKLREAEKGKKGEPDDILFEEKGKYEITKFEGKKIGEAEKLALEIVRVFREEPERNIDEFTNWVLRHDYKTIDTAADLLMDRGMSGDLRPKEAIKVVANARWLKRKALDKGEDFLYSEKEGVKEGTAKYGKPTTASQFSFDFKPAKREISSKIPLGQRVRMATTGNIKWAGETVSNTSQTASLLASIRKSAQENLYTVTVDKNNTILEIHRYSKGLKNQSQVSVSELVGRSLNIKEAKRVYAVHNHPSGTTKYSKQDMRLDEAIGDLLEAGDVEYQSIVIAESKYSDMTIKGEYDNIVRPILPAHRTKSLPVKERMLKKEPILKERGQINSEVDAMAFKNANNLEDGILLLDGANKPLSFLPFDDVLNRKEMTREVLKSADTTNALALIVFSDKTSVKREGYLKGLMERGIGELKLLDIIDKGETRRATNLWTEKIATYSKPHELLSTQELYSGFPLHKAAELHKKYIGDPLWDKVIMEKIPKVLDRIPGGKIVNRALLREYRGDLPYTDKYIKSLDEMRQHQSIGREYAVDLGKRLQEVPEASQLKIGQAITGQQKKTTIKYKEGKPELAPEYIYDEIKLTKKERSLADESIRTFYELGKQAAGLGLMSERTFFKHAGQYMPRLYTQKEYQSLLKIYNFKKPNRLDLTRFKKREDIPKALREEWGEILTPGYPVAKGIAQLTHDIEMAKFFKGIADNTEWSVPKVPVLDKSGVATSYQKKAYDPRTGERVEEWVTIKNYVDAQGKEISIPKEFVKLPKEEKLGPLSEAYVHPEIFKDLQETIKIMEIEEKVWRKALGIWKVGKIVNPKTMARNQFGGNTILSHLGGFPLWEQPYFLARAAKELKTEGKYYILAKETDLFGTTFTATELKQLFNNIEVDISGIKGKLPEGMHWSRKAWNKLEAGIQKGSKLYQLQEEWSKMAHMMHAIERKKMTPELAARDAEKWLFNYGKITKFQEKYRSKWYGAPFATFTFKSIPRIMEAAVKTPWRFAPIAAMVFGLEKAATTLIGDTKEERKGKRGLLPEWMKGSIGGLPNFARVPIVDRYGREHYWNMTFWLPWGDIAESGGLGPIPGSLMPMTQPFTKEMWEQIANYDLFWKKPIVKEAELAGKEGFDKLKTQAQKRGGHLMRSMAPTLALDVGRTIEAVRGRPDWRGRFRIKGVVAADLIAGIKMYPVDYADRIAQEIGKVDPQKGYLARQIKRDISRYAIKKKAMEEKGGPEDFYQKKINEAVQQLIGLAKETGKLGKLAEQAGIGKKRKTIRK